MRRVDLAESILLTASGITRLLEGLERSGLVGGKLCDTDRRVVYARLTEAGAESCARPAAPTSQASSRSSGATRTRSWPRSPAPVPSPAAETRGRGVRQRG